MPSLIETIHSRFAATPAKVGRQMTQELVKAGLVVEARINGAEAYTAVEYLPIE